MTTSVIPRCYVGPCTQPAIYRLVGMDWTGHGARMRTTRKVTRLVCGTHLSSIADNMSDRLGLAVTQSPIENPQQPQAKPQPRQETLL